MIRSVIIDDEVKGCEVLTKLIRQYCPGVEVTGTANSADEGEKLIRALQPDLVFLDIQMPHGSGFNLLQKISPAGFRVIFVTAYDEFALQAIKFSALDYLLKPVRIDDLTEAVEKFRNSARGHEQKLNFLRESYTHNRLFEKLAVSTLNDIRFISLKDIIYLESDNNYTSFNLVSREKIVSSRNLGSYEDMLEMHGFFRIHNSYIVNLSKISRFIKNKTGAVETEGGFRLEVSSRRKDELLKLLSL